MVTGCGRIEQGHCVDQHRTGSLSDKQLFLLRAPELLERKLASPGCDNSQSYFLALRPPRANNAQPRKKLERLRRATAPCGLGSETISLSVTPNPGGLRARASSGTGVCTPAPHLRCVQDGQGHDLSARRDARGPELVCTIVMEPLHEVCPPRTPTFSATSISTPDLSPLSGEDRDLRDFP